MSLNIGTDGKGGVVIETVCVIFTDKVEKETHRSVITPDEAIEIAYSIKAMAEKARKETPCPTPPTTA